MWEVCPGPGRQGHDGRPPGASTRQKAQRYAAARLAYAADELGCHVTCKGPPSVRQHTPRHRTLAADTRSVRLRPYLRRDGWAQLRRDCLRRSSLLFLQEAVRCPGSTESDTISEQSSLTRYSLSPWIRHLSPGTSPMP